MSDDQAQPDVSFLHGANGSTITLAQWGGRVLRAQTGQRYELVPDKPDYSALLTGVLVVPPEDYLEFRRGGGRTNLTTMLHGEVVVRYNNVVSYRAGADALADSWWRLAHIAEESGAREAGAMLHGVTCSLEELIEHRQGVRERDLETMIRALRLATTTWVQYRSTLSGVALETPIIVTQGSELSLERCEAYIPGPGPIIDEPLELELHVLEQTPLGSFKRDDDGVLRAVPKP